MYGYQLIDAYYIITHCLNAFQLYVTFIILQMSDRLLDLPACLKVV